MEKSNIQISNSLQGENSGSNGGSGHNDGASLMGEKDKPRDILKADEILQANCTLPEKKVVFEITGGVV